MSSLPPIPEGSDRSDAESMMNSKIAGFKMELMDDIREMLIHTRNEKAAEKQPMDSTTQNQTPPPLQYTPPPWRSSSYLNRNSNPPPWPPNYIATSAPNYSAASASYYYGFSTPAQAWSATAAPATTWQDSGQANP
ncbi:hypothetical protein COLO4_16340 [Corchorus olitorius]|uniref:Uncharacterized protein n=1 Tax=Corchorus olitorius TaxID=93759 RepID=A0A1R3JI21_9ROSI|nr:hypothetical protein COLO4_16340 [Corchorus olitorius]